MIRSVAGIALIAAAALVYMRQAQGSYMMAPPSMMTDPRAFFPAPDWHDTAQSWQELESLWDTPAQPYPTALDWQQLESSWDDAGIPFFDYPAASSFVNPITWSIFTMEPNLETQEKNLRAFLHLIRVIESNNNYRALVGGGEFHDFSDHPANKGWAGISLQKGLGSRAAGAYQIQPGTWGEVLKRTPLPDFSPASQDAAAVTILQFPWRNGAYNDVIRGNFDVAIQKLTLEWEAFQRILAGNYHINYAQARSLYAQAGGSIAGDVSA